MADETKAQMDAAQEIVPQVVDDSDPIGWLVPGQNRQLSVGYTKLAPAQGTAEYEDYLAEITQLMASGDAKIGDVIGEVILLRDVFVHKVRMRKEDKQTGEVWYQSGYRTVLVDADGHTYETTSDFIADGLSAIFQLCGHPSSWSAPKPIKFKNESIKGGDRHTYKAVLVTRDEAALKARETRRGRK